MCGCLVLGLLCVSKGGGVAPSFVVPRSDSAFQWEGALPRHRVPVVNYFPLILPSCGGSGERVLLLLPHPACLGLSLTLYPASPALGKK